MPTDLFPPSEFDDWAATYDESVQSSDFPFTGYPQVLRAIFDLAALPSGAAVLDLGAGTGAIAEMFARAGCRVWGVDFSEEMLVRARAKLPGAIFARADVRHPLPPDFPRRYDAIVSGYTFHHFPLDEKVTLARRLVDEHLPPGAPLLIGDIAFPTAAGQDAVRRALGDDWEQEYYWLADETLPALAAGLDARFHLISNCAGVFEIRGKER